jgi:hypothetical protein
MMPNIGQFHPQIVHFVVALLLLGVVLHGPRVAYSRQSPGRDVGQVSARRSQSPFERPALRRACAIP